MNLIVAVDQNWGIGKDGTMPWHISADMKYFREKTQGKTVLMGRKTLQSFPGGRPLPNRNNIVLSRDKTYLVEGAFVVNSLNKLIEYKNFDDVFVIGGGTLYEALLPYCRYAYVTKIGAAFDCDTHFPDLYAMDTWELIDAGEPLVENGIPFSFTVYENHLIKTQIPINAEAKEETMKDYNEELPPIETVDFNDLVLLEEVDNDFEADVKLSLLRSCSIRAYKRYSQFAAVAKIYCGSSNMGVMIYVPKADAEEAKKILAAPFDSSELYQDN